MFEKFMGFMQSEEGMAVEKKSCRCRQKQWQAVTPDKKAGIMFKIHVAHDMAATETCLFRWNKSCF